MLNNFLTLIKRTLDARSQDLFRHSCRVGELAREIVVVSPLDLGLSPREAYIAGLLHDIGKISIPDAILHKPGPLTKEEWTVMKLHPLLGSEFVRGTPFERYEMIICRHHELPDGTGYQGVTLDELPLDVRLIAVVDKVVAMMEDRPYRGKVEDPQEIMEIGRTQVKRFFLGELGLEIGAVFEEVLPHYVMHGFYLNKEVLRGGRLCLDFAY
jgi:HD-GYP domain-containing protein (c-di-GMP phosphodiesterase class II)